MQPPVLRGIFSNECFDGLVVLGGDPSERIALVGPFFREDNAIDTDFEEEAVTESSAVTDYYGQVPGDREQSDALVRAGFATEEIYEYALFAGVLIGDKAERCTARGKFLHHSGGAFLVDYALTGTSADAVQVVTDVLVVQRPGYAVDVEAKEPHEISHDFKIAVMGADNQQASTFLHEPFGPFGIPVPGILAPVVFLYQSRREQHVHRQHNNVLEAPSAYFVYPLFALAREARAQIVQSALSASVVVLPEQTTENAGGVEIGLDIEQVQKKDKNPQREIAEPVYDGIMLLFLLSFWHGRSRISFLVPRISIHDIRPTKYEIPEWRRF